MKTKNLVIIFIFILFIAFVRADNVYYLSGTVNSSEGILLDGPFFIGPYPESSEDIRDNTNYSVIFYSGDTELKQFYFEVYSIEIQDVTYDFFTFNVAIPDNAERMVFENLSDIIYGHYFSANAPVISNLNVVPDVDSYFVSWDALDTDGDEISYDIYYSIDGGDFGFLLTGYNSTSIDIPDSMFSQGEIRLKVFAYDGFHESSIVSASFTSGNNVLMTFILYPGTGSFFINGTELDFEGWAYDSESEISDYNWESDIDGYLGDTEFISANLSLGTHIITLTASDGLLSSSDSITITVTDETRPDVSVESIEMVTENPEAGQNVIIKALIRNIITDVFFNYSLYEGDPSNGGTLIEENVAFAQANDLNFELDLLWKPITLGLHNLYFLISGARPDESDTGNNLMSQEFNVSAGICTDVDMDTYCLEVDDCDDGNASIHPGAVEVCNGVDDNCNGEINESFVCPQQDPIAYYPFDGDCNDYSGNGFHGIPFGNVHINTTDGINGAAVFDGNGDFINISRVLNTKSFSVSGWVQLNGFNNQKTIFDTGNEISSVGITSNKPGAFIKSAFQVTLSKTEPIDYGWHYITWTYDEIGNHWKIYVDGERFAHISGGGDMLDSPLGIGSQYWGAFYNGMMSKYFRGKLDEMTIHNRALSEPEIVDLCGGLGSCFNTVQIQAGWNLLSIPIIPTTNDADREISLKAGWNMFGHLSQSPFLWSKAKVSDGIMIKTISEAESLGWLQKTIYYFDEDSQVYKYIPGDEAYLTANKGYWLYAVKDNLKLIFPKVGGALEDNSYNWLDAEVIKGTTTKTIAEAQSAGWLQSTIYYFDEDSQTYKFVPGDDDNVYPDRGYWLYSNEELSLVIS